MVIDKEIEKIKDAISSLVYDKTALRKAYQYYHGYRDADQFKHLEDNYGIGTPTSVSFTPLIKKHIDILVGEYLGLNQELKVTCKDGDTLSNIMREKQLQIDREVYDYLSKYVKSNIIGPLVSGKDTAIDPFIEKNIKEIKDNIEQNFVSEYEQAAQNILRYFSQSRNLDLKRKVAEFFTDILIGGSGYYRTLPNEDKTNICLEILNPLDTFIERNPNSPYLADSRRAVMRKWMTKEDVLSKYRSEITEEAAKKIDEMVGGVENSSQTYYVRYGGGNEGVERSSEKSGILAGLEAHPGLPGDDLTIRNFNHNLIEVFEVEWIEVDRKSGKQTRHEGVQIGEEIYITRGESDYIIRSIDCPNKCRLSINGIFFLDKNGDPYSLMVNTMDLQDKYDLLLYCRDNLIASSGTVGDWVDTAFIPTFLGDTLPERIQRWKGHKKDGIALFNSQMEGGERMTNTTFNGFDDTVKAQSIQAIQIAIQSIEQQASSITGVLPERLAQYEQRDAVSNVQLGVKMSGLLTKQYFEIMDTMYKEVNYDLLNLAKLIYKKGITGTLVLGDKYSKIFTALPEHYTITDFDIHIEDSSKSFQEMENVKGLNVELIKAGMSNPELAIEIATSKSMTHLKATVSKAMAQQQAKNDQTKQLQEQLTQVTEQAQEMQKQNAELQKQLKQLQSKISEQETIKLQLEQEKVAIEKERMKNQKDYNDKMIDIKDKQLSAQIEEARDDNPYNDRIKATV